MWEQPAAQPTYAPPAYTPPAYEPPASEPSWTPGPAPSEPAVPVEAAQPAATAPGGAGWEVVSPAATAAPEPEKKKGRKEAAAATGASWTLASGNVPGTEQEEEVAKRPSSTVAIAQYAVLVVGLIMVLIGVLVMVAESHVT